MAQADSNVFTEPLHLYVFPLCNYFYRIFEKVYIWTLKLRFFFLHWGAVKGLICSRGKGYFISTEQYNVNFLRSYNMILAHAEN